MAPSAPLTISSIGVIVGLDLVGDALIKLPFVKALRAAFPEASLHWITSRGPTAYNGPLREATRGLIDVVHETPRWLEPSEHHASETAEKPEADTHFDLLIDTRGKWREAIKARRTVSHALFLAPAARYLFSNRRPSPFQPRPVHLVDRLLQIVDLAAGFIPSSAEPLSVPEIFLAKARQIMPKDHVYIGFAPGAGNPVKIWPRERFAEVAAYHAAQGRVPVFLLGPQEQDWTDGLKELVPSALFPLQARKVWGTSEICIDETMAVGSLLSAAVANDSGTGHMLAAVDCPLLSLFGPTNPEKLAPRVSFGVVIRAQDFGGKTMSDIPVNDVLTITERMISGENPI